MEQEAFKKKTTTPPDPEHYDSYIRWQAIAITQLGYAINLMMTLAGGVLAFVIKEKLDGSIKATGCGWRSALLFVAASIAIAIMANITRAFDFRYTRSAARAHMKGGVNHQELHEKADCFGAWTWGLFYCQATSFLLGLLLLGWSLSRFL